MAVMCLPINSLIFVVRQWLDFPLQCVLKVFIVFLHRGLQIKTSLGLENRLSMKIETVKSLNSGELRKAYKYLPFTDDGMDYWLFIAVAVTTGFHGGSDDKKPACSAGNLDLTPWIRRDPTGRRDGNPASTFLWERPEGRAWWAAVCCCTVLFFPEVKKCFVD